MKKNTNSLFFLSESKRWRRMPHGTSLIQLISLRLVQELCSYILNPKVQVVVSQCILHMSVSEKICNSPLSSKVFSSSQFHPCIFILGFFNPTISSLHFHPPNFSSLHIPIWQGPTQCCEWFFFSHPNIFGVFVYFLASLMHLPTYKTQGSILYYPHLDIGTFKVYKYLNI